MGTRLRRRLVALDPSLTISTAILRSQIGLHGSAVFPGDVRVQRCIFPAQFSFRQFAGKRPALPYRIVSLARHRPVLTPRPAMHGSLSFSSPTIDICGQLNLLPAPIEPKLDDAESFPRCDLYKSPLAGRLVASFLATTFLPDTIFVQYHYGPRKIRNISLRDHAAQIWESSRAPLCHINSL